MIFRQDTVGEEFAIILPRARLFREVRFLRKDFVRQLKQKNFPGQDEPLHVTISLGVGAYPRDATNKVELIKKTDDALYFSKKNGRNQVWTVKEMDDKLAETGEKLDNDKK